MKTLITCIILLLALPLYAAAGTPRAGTCGGCHVENFSDWSSSAHSRSVSTERFRSALSDYLLKEGTDNGGYCFRCHAPAILISGGGFKATKRLMRGRGSSEGVTCIVCHSVESIKDGRAVYDPGGVPGYHRVKDLRSLDKESLCTTCHRSYKPESAGADITEGRIKGLASKFGRMVSTKNITHSDHKFSGATVMSAEDGFCPGIEGD